MRTLAVELATFASIVIEPKSHRTGQRNMAEQYRAEKNRYIVGLERIVFAFSTCVLEYPLSLDSNCILRFSEREPLKKPLLNPDLHQGYIELLTDLPCATPTRLRTFLNRYVIEGKNPRKLAVPLAQQLKRLASILRGESH